MFIIIKLNLQSYFIITGVLGPNSNAHGPNEFLHLDYCEKLIKVLTRVVMEYE